MDVSDPASPSYGRHWTSEGVIDVFRPSDETGQLDASSDTAVRVVPNTDSTPVNAVYHWLLDPGVSNGSITHSDNKAWLAFLATTKVDLIKEFQDKNMEDFMQVSQPNT